MGAASPTTLLRSVASCVTPGVWSCAVPFTGFLGYSFSYTIGVAGGVVLIDLGWDDDRSWDALMLGLTRAGAGIDDVVGVVVTHTHPDHFGLVHRIRQASDAWVAGHPAERLNVLGADGQRRRLEELRAWLHRAGVPTSSRESLARDGLIPVAMSDQQPFDVALQHGDPVPGTDGALVALHTPGHTAGHMCFLDADRGLLFSGDHLLPRVTPNVSCRPGSLTDPLTAYEESLTTIAEAAPGTLVCPGHEWAFDRPSDRAQAIRQHCEDRSDEVLRAVAGGATTTWDVAQTVGWSRPFADLDVRGVRQALGETLAHLRRLALRGALDESGQDVAVWSIPGARLGNESITELSAGATRG